MSIITKKQIVEMVAESTEVSEKDVKNVIETFFGKVELVLAHGDKVQLRDIGTFEVRDAKERIAKNPQNPEEIIIVPACKKPVFKFSKTVKNKMNA